MRRILVMAIAMGLWLDVTPVASQVASPAAAQAAPTYRPPLERSVSDPFDHTASRYGAGNRGLDYDVAAGDLVGAIGAGTVVFAGRVAGKVWVTVLHPDGLRSSSGPLATISVTTGDRVEVGTPLGTTGDAFHLGVRDSDRYLDPARLFVGQRRPARLVALRWPGSGYTPGLARPDRSRPPIATIGPRR